MRKFFKTLFNNAIGSFIGSCVTLLWLELPLAIAVFVSVTISGVITSYLFTRASG
jgi:hypothetical protein